MNDRIYKINANGKDYKINIQNNEIKSVSKIENNKEVLCTKEEIKYIIALLNKSYNEEEIKDIYTDSIIETIKQKIDDKEIKNYDELEKYLIELNLSQSQNKEVLASICQYFKTLMHSNDTTLLEDYFNKTKEIIQKSKNSDQKIFIEFKVSSGIVKQTIKTFDEKEQKTTILLEKSFDYTLETKSHLITPIIGETIMTDEPIKNEINAVDMFTANYNISTKNVSISIQGCERSYADDTYKFVNEAKQVSQDTVKAQMQATENYKNSSPEEQINQDLKDYGNLTPEEQQALIEEKGVTRKLTKKSNNSAHINQSTLIILIIIGIIILTFITYIIIK